MNEALRHRPAATPPSPSFPGLIGGPYEESVR
ncbi:hypothetical protein ACVW19_002263 [Streptomyces sp. TE5632]